LADPLEEFDPLWELPGLPELMELVLEFGPPGRPTALVLEPLPEIWPAAEPELFPTRLVDEPLPEEPGALDPEFLPRLGEFVS
jgi:hypothetical protein